MPILYILAFRNIFRSAREMDSPYDLPGALARALAHPIRLHLLEALTRREACVCHLTALLGQRQALISQHLRVLREAGLVVDRREGQMVFYRLADGRAAALLSLLKDLSRAVDPALAFPEPPEHLAECPCRACSAAREPSAGADARCCEPANPTAYAAGRIS